MRYAIIFDEQNSDYSWCDGPHDSPTISTSKVFKEYESVEAWESAIIEETNKQYGRRVFRAITFSDVEVTTKISIKVGT